MKTLLARDYEVLTKNILAKTARDEAALAELVTKTAAGMEMAPEQIRTLVRSVNTMAHLAAMDKKVAGDKYVDFEPVDPDSVIKQIYAGTARPSVRTAEERVSDFLGNVGEADTPIPLDQDEPDATKEAAAGDTKEGSDFSDPVVRSEGVSYNPAYSWEIPEAPGAAVRRQRGDIDTLNKVAEEIRDRKLNYAIAYRENLEKLALSFRKLGGPDIDMFEKDAIALHDDFGAGVARQVRTLAHLPPSKTASADIPANRIIDDTTEIRLLEKMAKVAEDYAVCDAGLKKINNALTLQK